MLAMIKRQYRRRFDPVKSGEQLVDEWGSWLDERQRVGTKAPTENEGGKVTTMTLTSPERDCDDLQRIDKRYPEAGRVNEVLRELPTDEYDACYYCRFMGKSQDDFAEIKGISRRKVKELMTLAEGAVFYAINCAK